MLISVIISVALALIGAFIKTLPHAIEHGWIFPLITATISIIFLNYVNFAYYSLYHESIPAIIAYGLCALLMIVGFYGMYVRLRGHRLLKSAKDKLINPDPAPKLCVGHNPRGVVFGIREDFESYIAKSETLDGHIMIIGGVGSGKSSCLAIPTLRAWRSRVFAIDIKGELYAKTHEYRSDIKVFNPQDDNSYGYDPYVFLRASSNHVQEARAIAQAIIPLPPENKDPFWIESAQTILTGAILHYYTNHSFIDTLREMQSHGPQELIKIIAGSGNPKARMCVGSYIDMEPKTLSSIFAELSRATITLVTDDELVSALSKSRNIAPEDLEYGNDIYIKIPEHLLKQWKNLLTLIVNQFLTFFERRDENNNIPILFLLDEFPRLGKIPVIIEGLATLRSKKITICLIAQSIAQLDVIYSEKVGRVIADTCSYKAILGATDTHTQEYFSKLFGTYEKEKISKNRGLGLNGLTASRNISETTEDKRIIKPEEFATLDTIALLTPHGNCFVDKAPYFFEDIH